MTANGPPAVACAMPLATDSVIQNGYLVRSGRGRTAEEFVPSALGGCAQVQDLRSTRRGLMGWTTGRRMIVGVRFTWIVQVVDRNAACSADNEDSAMISRL